MASRVLGAASQPDNQVAAGYGESDVKSEAACSRCSSSAVVYSVLMMVEAEA